MYGKAVFGLVAVMAFVACFTMGHSGGRLSMARECEREIDRLAKMVHATAVERDRFRESR